MSVPTVRLAEVAEINPRMKADLPGSYQVSFLGMADLDAERGVTTRGVSRTFGEVAKGYTQFVNRDLLVAKITPCFENGKICQADLLHERGAGSTEFHVIRPDRSRIDDRYLLFYLRQPWIRLAGERRMTGSAGQRRVPEAFIADLPVPLPSLDEQVRIVQVLSQVDALRAKRRDAIALLDQLAESIFLDMFGDPARNPLDWKIKRVGDLVESVSYGTSVKASLEGTIPVLRMNNITVRGEIDLRDLKYMDRQEVSDRYLARSGDILFNRTNSADLVGKTAIYRGEDPLAYAGYLIRVRVNDRNHPEYLAAFLNSRYAKRVLRGMCKSIIGMANINAQELQSINVAEPPLGLQQEFAKKISSIEAMKGVHRVHQGSLDALFASVRNRAFRGELSSDAVSAV